MSDSAQQPPHSNNRPFRPLAWVARGLVLIGSVAMLLMLVHELSDPAPSYADGKKASKQNKKPAKDEGETSGDTLPSKAGLTITEVISSEEDIARVEDPITLIAAGKHYLESDRKLARACFVAAVERDEINHYAGYAGKIYGDAAIDELMEDYKASRAKWDEAFAKDILTAYRMYRTFSRDPKKEDRLAKAREHLEEIVKEAKAGEEPLIYVTKKGKKRKLKTVSLDDALAAFAKGEKLRYAYIEDLDLTGKTFDKPINCQRCVVGKLSTYGSTFKDRVAFKGFVMGDAHLGRKWRGAVNMSSSIEAAHFDTLFLGFSVILGDLNLDSVNIHGRILNMPLTVVEGAGNLKKLHVSSLAEFRYARFGGAVDLKGAEFGGATYFGNAHMGGLEMSRVIARKNIIYFNSSVFDGPVNLNRCELGRGITFENSTFNGDATFRQSRVEDRMNFSLTKFRKSIKFNQIEVTVVDFLGAEFDGEANFNDNVFVNNARFSIDTLVRRSHIDNPDPLQRLYKQYQGDEDAEHDMTSKSQYGVTHPDHLTAVFKQGASFSNSIFDKLVTFEGVKFGSEGEDYTANFYNTQFYGEAHFEHSKFYGPADFRTIFASEISFDVAVFYDTWMLDDCNIPGRLSLTDAVFQDGTTMSFNNTNIKWFGIDSTQVINQETGLHRLFYQQCVEADLDNAKYSADPRLFDARWDSVNEVAITDPELVAERTRAICADRIIDGFVALKDSYDSRGMNIETDWSYWHERHFKNKRMYIHAPLYLKPLYILRGLIFEQAFGWGVELSNLLFTGLITIVFFTLMQRLFCAGMVVGWDGKKLAYRDLPIYAMLIVSFHSFLGGVGDWNTESSQRSWQILYTAEIIVGIILITFFIGAYTRMVLA